MTDQSETTPSRRVSDAGKAAWDAWLAAEKRLAEIDQQRRAALDEKDRLHCEMMRIGRQEGWHA
jgi:DNA repair ATPase RecN